MSWYVYILLCDQKSLYIGLTSNLRKRFQSHKNKQNLATKEFKQIELVYSEQLKTRLESERREKQLKGWSRAKKNALINGNVSLLKRLSRSRSVSN